jgi:hypothetical protein
VTDIRLKPSGLLNSKANPMGVASPRRVGNRTISNALALTAGTCGARSGDCWKRCCKVGVFINQVGTVSSTALGHPCPADFQPLPNFSRMLAVLRNSLANPFDANAILSVGWRRPLSLDACLNAGYRTLRLALSRPGSADDGSPLGSLRCCSPLQVRSPRSWVGNASATGGTRLSGSCLPYTGPRCSGCGTHSRVNSLHESV